MAKKSKKYEDEEEIEDSEDAESDMTESDFEDPDQMEVITEKLSTIILLLYFFIFKDFTKKETICLAFSS